MIKDQQSLAAASKVKPPATRIGIVGWVRANLFNSFFNSVLTMVVLFVLYQSLIPFFKWALLGTVISGSGAECKNAAGACWAVIVENIRFILFGFYPYDQHWRPAIAICLLAAMLFASQKPKFWNKYFFWVWVLALAVMGVLMKGGVFGLVSVESSLWSGLPLTLLLSVFGLTAAYPLGVILALGRQSRLPAIKFLCVLYIELIRGVPLITLLFMASILFPLFLPEGVNINKIIRAQAAIILFTAAYIAEVVRGGLQAIPLGQYEAAESLGLNYYLKMRLIILPQALKIVIPPTVSVLISAFKDTSLVVIIALFDLLNTTLATLANPEWMGFSVEAYIFVALLYFIGCFSMSNLSRRLEEELSTGRER